MSTFIKTIENIREYVSTAFNFSFDVIAPYITKVERQKIKTLIGSDTYNAWATSEPTTGTPAEVYKLFSEASANLSVLHYIPIGVVNIGNNGITVSESANTKTANYGQILDLKRELLGIANTAIDEALETMEANSGDFPLWTPTENYTVFNELLVPKTSDFQRFFNIQNSRQTFIALRAYQLEIQSKVFTWLDDTTYGQIKSATSDIEKQAREMAQRAQVNFSVAKAAESGVFVFKSTGMFIKYAEVPVEKHHEMTEKKLERLIKSRNAAAQDAMKTLKEIVVENVESTFTGYVLPTTDVVNPIINTKSIVSF